jgi:hypothetical protein
MSMPTFEIRKSFLLPNLSTNIVPIRALTKLKTCRPPLMDAFVLVEVMPLLKHYPMDHYDTTEYIHAF